MADKPKKYRVVARRFEDGNVFYDSAKMHPHRIDQVGEEIDYEDDAYNTSYPTGYERAYSLLKFEDGKDEWIDTAFLRKEE